MTWRWIRRSCNIITKYWLLVTWAIVNIIIFCKIYIIYRIEDKYEYLRKMLGCGLCVSRASAAVLNISCCLVLLPVCQHLNSSILHVLGRISRHALMWWLESVHIIHVTSAVTIIIFAAIHTTAHIVNVVNFSYNFNQEYEDINWARYQGQNSLEIIFTSVAGVTGVGMVLILTALTLTSVTCVRQYHYNTFWIVHHCSLLFFLLLLAHPLSGILREQINVEQHSPDCYQRFYNHSENKYRNSFLRSNVCVTPPVFMPIKSQSWMWIVPSLCIYIIDLLWRMVKRNNKKMSVIDAKRLSGNAIELKLACRKQNFNCYPGQYILLQSPNISSIQWHAYTLTSCPTVNQPYFTVIVKARGDWSGKLCGQVLTPFHHYEPIDEILKNGTKFISLLVDGPYRSSMENVIHSEVAVCIAAGIGITPFSASLYHLLNHAESDSLPSHIRLIWIIRNMSEMLWFTNLFTDLYEKFWNTNQPDRFEFSIQVTKDFNKANIQKILGDNSAYLYHRIKSGRPDWSKCFYEWDNIYKNKHICIFVCGPKPLTTEIHRLHQTFNNQGSSFHLVHEVLS